MTLHPPGGMIFDKHDKSRRYLTLMTVYMQLHTMLTETRQQMYFPSVNHLQMIRSIHSSIDSIIQLT